MNLEEELNIEKKEETVESETSDDNFKMPEPSKETFNFPTDSNQYETEASKAFDRACASRCDDLELGKTYYGHIKEVVYSDDSYPRIALYITLLDNDLEKRIVQEYSFGGKYGDFNMKKLVDLLGNIRDFQLSHVDKYSYETIAKSIQFLTSAKVSVIKKQTENEKNYYVIDVIGKYDNASKRIV